MPRGGLLIAIGACLLLLLVPMAMCVGLSADDDAAAEERDVDTGSEVDEEPLPEDSESFAETEPSADETPEPAPLVGQRVLWGTVRSADGEPIEGADVAARDYSRLRVVTDERGTYRLEDVPLVALTLTIAAPGYAEARLEVGEGDPDAEQRVDAVLEIGDGVAGTVVDADGRPVQGARVACAGSTEREVATETDSDGRYELPARAAGCDAVAEHDRLGASPRVELALGPGNLIALQPPGSIAGTAVDEQGKPLSSFVLSIVSFRPLSRGTKGRSHYRQTFLHPQGRFVVSGLAAGSYVLSVSTPRHAETRSESIAVAPGRQVEGVRIVVRGR